MRLYHRRGFVGSSALTCAERRLSLYHYDFLKSYLYRLSRRDIASKQIAVRRLVASSESFSHRSKSITVSDDLDGQFVRVTDMNIMATITVGGKDYDVSCFWEAVMGDAVAYFCFVQGLDTKSCEPQTVLDTILREAIQRSPFRNSLLEIGAKHLSSPDDAITEVRRLKVNGEESLEDIYLPIRVRRDVEYFIRALKEHRTFKKTLRYLLSGKPGTAKTKLIRSIANSCSGEATFIFTSGSDRRIESLFEFASIFSPVVLCIDDIDMMTGSREEGLHNSLLAHFLQKLDGFAQNELFLLATTNDKRLVDFAASRPGRFDAVIDIGCIEPEQYLSLVKSKTTNTLVLELFDDWILNQLESKKVTGAFIANLVKHLELVQALEPELLSRDYLAGRIKESFEGFYKQQELQSQSLGFN